MKVSKTRHYYHGSPVRIEVFDIAYVNKSDQAVLGAGFYFTSDPDDAMGYVGDTDKACVQGVAIEPTLHRVKLDVKNPLVLGVTGPLSQMQVEAIVRQLPSDTLEDRLWDRLDVGSMGVERALRQACSTYAGDEVTLSYRLFQLANDFFDDHIDILNRAVMEVLGFDGIITKNKSGVVHVCAWFPEQVRIVSRTPAREYRPDSPCPG